MRVVVAMLSLVISCTLATGALAAPRLVVGELFTNTYCPPCATYDPALEAWADANEPNFALVCLHGWWPGYGDVFWQADSLENRPRINYYGADYAPHLRFDGVADLGSSITPGGWSSALSSRMGIASPLAMNIMSTTYNQGTQSGTISGTITNETGSVVSGNLRIMLLEDIPFYFTPGGNGYHVNKAAVRDMIPTHSGTAVSVPAFGSTPISQAFTIAATTPPAPGIVPDDTHILAFVQGATKEIYQAARLYFPYNGPSFKVTGRTQAVLPGGDGDAYLDAGESGSLVVTVTNRNPHAAPGATGALTSSDPYVTIVDGAASFGSIAGFGSGSNGGDPFTFSVSPGAPSGYHPELTLTITSGVATSSHSVAVAIDVGSPTDHIGPAGAYYAYENTDASAYTERPTFNWVEISSALGGPGTMMLPADEASATPAIGFTFRYYGVNYDTISVSTNGWIAMGRQFGVEPEPTPGWLPRVDGQVAMIAGVWGDLNPAAGGSGKLYRYYDAANHRFIVEWDRVSWFDSPGLKETFQIILLDPAFYPTANGDGEILVQYLDVQRPSVPTAGIENPSQTIGIEYSRAGVPNPAAGGLVDGRVIKYSPDAPTRTDVPSVAGTGTTLLMAASPNPFNGSTSIAFRVPAEQQATLRVFGVDGRLVATLFDGIAEAGTTSTRWNGLDTTGNPVAAGLYFARLETQGTNQVGKVMVLR